MEKSRIVKMEPKTTDRQPRTLRKIAAHGFTGAIIGLLFALIPLSFAWGSDSFQTIHIMLTIGFAAFCGILSAVSGDKFIDKLIDLSQFMPPV
jgi:hypothetical protein